MEVMERKESAREAERTRMIHEKGHGFLPVAGSNIHTKNKRKKVIHSVFGVGKTENRKEK